MARKADYTFFPGVFAPTLSLDQLYLGNGDAVGSRAFDLTDPEPLADEHLAREDSIRAVRAFVSSLTPRDQKIVRGIFWDERSQAEVAKTLGVSKMAISKRLASVMERGRAILVSHQGSVSVH